MGAVLTALERVPADRVQRGLNDAGSPHWNVAPCPSERSRPVAPASMAYCAALWCPVLVVIGGPPALRNRPAQRPTLLILISSAISLGHRPSSRRTVGIEEPVDLLSASCAVRNCNKNHKGSQSDHSSHTIAPRDDIDSEASITSGIPRRGLAKSALPPCWKPPCAPIGMRGRSFHSHRLPAPWSLKPMNNTARPTTNIGGLQR